MGTALWLRTDEAEDVAGSLRHALRAAGAVTEDLQAWKWLILGVHSALQGACICHLATTAPPLGVVDDECAAQWNDYLEERRVNAEAKMPKIRLMELPKLLKKARRPGSCGEGGSGPGLDISDATLNRLIHLHEKIRNGFVHYSPMFWSVELSGVPDLARLACNLILQIDQAGWAFRHKTDAWRADLRRDCERLSALRV